jgi:hypothetical protein
LPLFPPFAMPPLPAQPSSSTSGAQESMPALQSPQPSLVDGMVKGVGSGSIGPGGENLSLCVYGQPLQTVQEEQKGVQESCQDSSDDIRVRVEVEVQEENPKGRPSPSARRPRTPVSSRGR